MHSDFIDFLAALEEAGVRHMIVGGYAFQFHVQPRATKDLDVWVEPSKENLVKLSDALLAFAGEGISPNAVLNVLKQGKLGFKVGGVPPFLIEVLLAQLELDFETAYARQIVTKFKGQTLRVIHPQDLIRTKLACGRPQDLADVAGLRAIYGSIDHTTPS